MPSVHYPDIPRQSAGGNRVVKPKADEMALRGMAVLAQRLGFNSPQIQQLVDLSPDRQLARDVLAKARNPGFYTYNTDTFESLVTRICECFSEAVPIDVQTSREPITSRESPLKERCGLPLHRDQKRDSQLLFLDILHNKDLPLGTKVTTIFVRRCVYLAFFGRLPDSLEPSPLGSPSFSASPLFFPHDDLPLAVAPNQTQNWRNYGSRGHDRDCRDVVHQVRGRRKQVRRRKEQREQRGLRVAHQLRAADCQSRMVQDTEAELESRSPDFSRPERLSESSFVDTGDLENKLQADCANGTED